MVVCTLCLIIYNIKSVITKLWKIYYVTMCNLVWTLKSWVFSSYSLRKNVPYIAKSKLMVIVARSCNCMFSAVLDHRMGCQKLLTCLHKVFFLFLSIFVWLGSLEYVGNFNEKLQSNLWQTYTTCHNHLLNGRVYFKNYF